VARGGWGGIGAFKKKNLSHNIAVISLSLHLIFTKV
jgi:hypothetical protein